MPTSMVPFSNLPLGSPLPGGILSNILGLIYGRRYLELQAEYAKMKIEERKLVIKELASIAMSTTDPDKKYQMFQAIMMFWAYSN